MKNVFVTSDTHFGHHNIIRYCNRPFADVSAMNESLIERWNAVVQPGDIVYHLGDFAFLPWDKIPDVLNRLNGYKKLVPGNHDKQMKRLHASFSPIGIPLFEMLPPIYELEWEGTKFVMCHFPIQEWENKDHGSVHLHGHTHTQFFSWKAREQKEDRSYDIGVDMYGGPVRLSLDALNNPKGWN